MTGEGGDFSEIRALEQIEALLHIRRFDEAIKQALTTLSSHPDSYLVHTILARAHLGAENIEEANQAAMRAIKLTPDDGFGYYLRSIIMRQRKSFDEELRMATAAAELDPEDPDYVQRLAEAQLQSGLFGAAKKTAEQLVQLEPNSQQAHELLGDINLECNNFLVAEEHYRAALALAPNDLSLLNNLSICLRRQKKVKEAVLLLFDAARAHPDNPVLQENLYSFIKDYIDTRTLKGRRGNSLQELPLPIQHFYRDRKGRINIFERYSNYVMAAFWVLLLASFAALLEWLN